MPSPRYWTARVSAHKIADMSEQRRQSHPQFYLTPEHPCSYLPERQARTLFLDPAQTVGPALYSQLSRLGFRRSGSHLYRPHCDSCQACIATRIPVGNFKASRRQRRIRRRNADLAITQEAPQVSDEYYDLYARYIQARHADGDMYPPSRDQYRSFLTGSWSDTSFVSLRQDQRLLAVAVTDQLADGLSAIYTFFDPDIPARSLGVYALLIQIDLCRELDLPYLYLGYWVKDCQKMRYKTDYRPLQMLVNDTWVQIN